MGEVPLCCQHGRLVSAFEEVDGAKVGETVPSDTRALWWS